MFRAAQYAGYFFASCAANSLVSWLALQSVEGANVAKFFYCLIVLFVLFLSVCDDGIQQALKVLPVAYYSVLGCIVFSVLIGGCLIWISR
jgi:O-antigen/teichoic acid export membrane protein